MIDPLPIVVLLCMASLFQKAMKALGEEREFLASVTRDLDASRNERDMLLLEIEDRKSKVKVYCFEACFIF